MDSDARILVIDDSPDQLRLLSRVLGRAGYDVIVASTAAEGMRLVKERDPDLVLLDRVLADTDGIEICRQIKRAPELAHTFVVLWSAHHISEDQHVAGLDAGADEYVTRPVGNREILARVRAIVRLKKTEDALREKDFAIASAISAIAVADLEGNLTYVNEAFLTMWGYDDEKEVLGKQAVEFWNVPEEAAKVIQALRDQGSWIGELVGKKKDGALLDVQLSANMIADKVGRPISMMASFLDITERVRAEEALRESEERYRTLFEGVPVGLYRTTPDGHILDINPALLEMLGFPDREAALRMNVADGYANPADRARWQALLDREAIVRGFEAQWHRRDGTAIWVKDSAGAIRDAEGRVLYYEGAVEDITERKRAEEALRESEERLEMALEGADEGLWDLDTQTGRLYLSPRSCVMLGFEPDQVEPDVRWWEDRIHPQDAERVRLAVQAHLEGRTPYYTTEHRVRTKSGEWKWILDRGKVVERDEGGRPLREAGIHLDVTERKRAEEQLAEAQRMAHLGSWEWDIAHNTTVWSDELYRIFGVDVEQFDPNAYEAFLNCLHPEDRERVASVMEGAIRDPASFGVEYRIVRPDREVRHILAHGKVVFDEVGRPVKMVGVSQDVTERVRAEEALRESEQKFRLISEQSLLGIAIIQDDQIRYANQALADINGYSVDQMRSWKPIEYVKLIHPDDLAFAVEQGRKKQMGEQDAVAHYPYRLITKAGEVKWLDQYSRTILYEGRHADFVTLIDITERVRAEEALRESEENFRQIAETVREVFWVGSPDSQKIHYVSPLYEEVWGRSCQSLYDEPLSWLDAVHADDRGCVLAAIEERASGVLADPGFPEYRVVRPDGSVRWILSRTYPVYDESGQVVRIVGIAEDITERVRAEEELRESEERFRNIFAQSPVGIELYDRDGMLIDVNAACLEIFGVKDLEAVRGFDLFEDPNLPQDARERLLAAQAVQFEAAFDFDIVKEQNLNETTRSGQCTLDSYITPFGLDPEDPQGFLVHVADITQRKQAEEALRESKDQLQALFDNMSNGFAYHRIVTDETGKPVDYIFLEANAAFERYTDLRRDDIIGRRVTEVLPGIENMEFDWIGTYGKVALTGEPTQFEQHFEPLDRWYSVAAYSPSRGYFAVTFEDVSERKRAGEALRESEARYRRLVENSPDIVYAYSSARGALYWSPRVQAVLGYSPADLIEKPFIWHDSIHPDDLELTDRVVEEGGQGMGFDIEYRIRDAEGGWHWLRDRSISTRRVGDETIIEGLATDVTERKQAEEALRLHSEIMANMAEGVNLVRPSDGVIVYTNPTFDRMFGYDPGELVGKHVSAINVPTERDPEEVVGEIRESLARTGAWQGQVHNVRKDGTSFWCDASVSAFDHPEHGIVAISVHTDITERRQAQEERGLLLAQVREQAREMQQIMDTVPEGVLLLDAERRVVLANPAAQRDLQILADAAVGDVLEYLGSGLIENLLTWPEDTAWHEIRADEYTYAAIARPLSSESNGWVMVLRDMTRERELQERIRQQDRMAAIGQLAGGVAHDFNNILMAIIGYNRFVLDELSPGDPRRADLDEVRKATERAAALVRQLLTFSRKQVLQLQVLDLNVVIANMEKMLRRLIGEDVNLNVVPAPSLGKVRADPGQVEQVVMNLCVNARDAMPKGGQLTVETQDVTLDRAYVRRYPDVEPGEYVLLAVSDTGAGMTEEVKAHLFEPFFTTKEQGKGTGLGLSTVWGIVKQVDGHIEVDSAPGEGTTFRIYLPRSEDKADLVSQEEQGSGLPGGAETILVVEDDDVVRMLARRCLSRCGYTVIEAKLPNEALRLGKEHGNSISLLLTDVVMPEMSGKDLAEKMASTCPDMKVLYMSGYTGSTIDRHGLLESGAALLQKPFEIEELACKVREILDES
jgi:PAS domain S-box-containing protein